MFFSVLLLFYLFIANIGCKNGGFCELDIAHKMIKTIF